MSDSIRREGESDSGFSLRNPSYLVSVFLGFTFLWTWTVNLVQLPVFGSHHVSGAATTLASFAPSIVAVVLTRLVSGSQGLRDLGRRLRPDLRTVRWSIVAVLVAYASMMLAFQLYRGLSRAEVHPASVADLVGTTLVLIPLTGFFEEIGWRGVMLERLQSRLGAWWATMSVALAWGVWHIPMILRTRSEGAGTPMFLLMFLLGTFPLSVLFTTIYNAAGQKLWPVIVFHAAVDASAACFLGPVAKGDLRAFGIWIIIITIIAVGVVRSSSFQLPGLNSRGSRDN